MDDYEEMLMTKAAWHYYFEGITQQQAAERMGISRMRMSSCLKRPGRQALFSSACEKTAKPACRWNGH